MTDSRSPDSLKHKKEGDKLFKKGDYIEAVHAYLKAIELDGRNTAAWNNLGYTFSKLGKTEEARRCREKKEEIEAQQREEAARGQPADRPGEHILPEQAPGEGGKSLLGRIGLSGAFAKKEAPAADSKTAVSGPAAPVPAGEVAEPEQPLGEAETTPAPLSSKEEPAAVTPTPQRPTPHAAGPGMSDAGRSLLERIGLPGALGKREEPAVVNGEATPQPPVPETPSHPLSVKEETALVTPPLEQARPPAAEPGMSDAGRSLLERIGFSEALGKKEEPAAGSSEMAPAPAAPVPAAEETAPEPIPVPETLGEPSPVDAVPIVTPGESEKLTTVPEPSPEPARKGAGSMLAGTFAALGRFGKKEAPSVASGRGAPAPRKTSPAMTRGATGPVPGAAPYTLQPAGAMAPALSGADSEDAARTEAVLPPSSLAGKLALPFRKKKVARPKIGILADYDPDIHGSLVEAGTPPDSEIVDQYWIDRGRAQVLVVRNTLTNQREYLLFEPVLSDFEYELLERLYEDLRDVLLLTDDELYTDRREVLFENVQDLLVEYGLHLEEISLLKLQYYIQRNFLGWLRIDALMKDAQIEDISCDGIRIPLFLYHRKHRNIRTNIRFEEEDLNSLAITLAQRSGKHISIGSPMIGATLPGGSRLQLSLGTEVTTRGTSFTIRKFREVPFTPIELMEFNTFDLDSLVYFWMAIENNKSLLFVGGTASGKTTSLNAVALFMPPLAKVVSIEDTREITLYHENWIASVTRESVGEGFGSTIMMFDLLKAAMRQRPEYIIVGEVRGVEAQTLFQAMNTGHTTFSTMHAGSVDAAIHRLESDPLNVPRNMIQALNIVSVQALIHRGGERVRRCLEIVELAGIDPVTGNMQVNTVFEYNPVTDLFSYTGRSLIYADIQTFRGWSNEQFAAELETRRRILQAMYDQGIRDYTMVARIIQAYAGDRDEVLNNIDNLGGILG
ncbi:MAG TPA: Flp pilus assembly complex ATPase component TadA [Methanoregulaceae archaeon]|nr:Flp pilus assembly complex ATPase component TadA [Methanoregulaceae archaeon]